MFLVGRSHVHESFGEKGFEFQLTRTDRNFNKETQSYDEEVVVLAESENFGTKAKDVSTALQTTNNEWVITVQYDETSSWVNAVIAVVCIIVAFCIVISRLHSTHTKASSYGTRSSSGPGTKNYCLFCSRASKPHVCS